MLLAGNVYLQELAPALAPQLAARIMPVGTYIVCSKAMPAEQADALIPCGAAVCDTNFVLDYFRTTADHRMLYGGRVSYSTATPMNLAASMQKRMAHDLPAAARRRGRVRLGRLRRHLDEPRARFRPPAARSATRSITCRASPATAWR